MAELDAYRRILRRENRRLLVALVFSHAVTLGAGIWALLYFGGTL